MKLFTFLLVLAIATTAVTCYSIPGVSSQQYQQNQEIKVYALQLESLQSMIPYAFEDHYRFFKTEEQDLSLTEQLLGQKKVLLPTIEFRFLNDTSCTKFGEGKFRSSDVKKFQYLIDNAYTYDLIIDNLPAVLENQNSIPVGQKITSGGSYRYEIYNHFKFVVEYNKNNIVGFNLTQSVNGYLLNTTSNDTFPSCGLGSENLIELDSRDQNLTQDMPIHFTYEVIYVKNELKTQASRWDRYKQQEGETVHWNNILCSFGVNVSLSALIYFILKRILNKDFANYEKVNQNDEDDMGWKQLKSDVFRPPGNPIVLASMVGVGLQLAIMLILTVFFIALYYLAEQYRTEKFLEALIILYVITGLISGYYSARYYKMMSGVYWIRSTLLTSVLLPGLGTLIFFEIEFSYLIEDSTNAYGFGTIFKLFFIWFAVQIPLTFLGSVIGFKRPKMEGGCTVNPVPQFIPPQPKFLSRHFLCVLGGILPFGTILMELQYIMNSVWTHSFYHLFGFILLALILLIITCAEISILLTYLQLNNGNHKWWWNAFYSSGFCGVYVFAYGFFYWLFYLQISQVSSTIMYFGIMGMASFGMFLICGSVGLIASYTFVKFIYSQIKAD
ncbi:hypothetical protein ABPG74_009216 [Tetrahymena malaccensis]